MGLVRVNSIPPSIGSFTISTTIFSESHDLAKEKPEKLAELKQLW
jgi:hypothetical protein